MNATTETPFKAGPCTLYTRSMFGSIIRTEVREIEITRRPYAQYKAALDVRFTEKGKRKRRGFVEGYKPFAVVVQTADAIAPDAMFLESEPGSNLKKGRYSMCDPRWESDFIAKLKAAGVAPLFASIEGGQNDAATD